MQNMENNFFENVDKITINTGNILSLIDITKKSGQNPSEELVEAINITFKDFKNGIDGTVKFDGPAHITRRHDDLRTKLAEYDSADLKIGLKVFLSCDEQSYIIEAIENAFLALNVEAVDNLVIAFNDSTPYEDPKQTLEKIQKIWPALETYVKNEKIHQIGIADVEENVFRQVHEWSSVKPNIIQINLATCCIVPPSLQGFCKENEIQLLTHSDPGDILPESSIHDIFGSRLAMSWAVRILVHIKCRGVLASKGYLIALSTKKEDNFVGAYF